MHHATLKSTRLQRVLKLLKTRKRPQSTLDIARKAKVCAVNSIVSELRCLGFDIPCHRENGIFYYKLIPS